jgi:sucrose phosphorylase
MKPTDEQLKLVNETVFHHIDNIYHELLNSDEKQQLSDDIIHIMRLDDDYNEFVAHQNNWDQADVVLITYGNSIHQEGEAPLKTLHRFLDENVQGIINSVHILPFFPYCSDDGFAVMDYYEVNKALGDWDDIESIANNYHLMADLVINHGSSSSQWFKNFIQGSGKGHDYFYTAPANAPIQQVVRPRTTPLLRSLLHETN